MYILLFLQKWKAVYIFPNPVIWAEILTNLVLIIL